MLRSIIGMLLGLALVLALSAPAQAARAVELREAERIAASPVPGRTVSAAQMREAILTGSLARGWRAVESTDRQVVLRNVIRGKHTVVVAVDFDEQGFTVNYRSSEHLNYKEKGGKRYIHPKYYEWVNRLELDIQSKLPLS